MIINVGESSAKATSYDDTSTSLGANNVQGAIEALKKIASDNASELTTLATKLANLIKVTDKTYWAVTMSTSLSTVGTYTSIFDRSVLLVLAQCEYDESSPSAMTISCGRFTIPGQRSGYSFVANSMFLATKGTVVEFKCQYSSANRNDLFTKIVEIPY